jgi:hypothetical protein
MTTQTATQQQQTHAIHWFEIPVADIERAQAFYERVLGKPLRRETMDGAQLAVFPSDKDAVAGALFAAPVFQPATSGTVVYLNAEPSLDAVLSRVEAAGGRIATPRTELPDGMGVFALLTDLDGNRVGLHAMA